MANGLNTFPLILSVREDGALNSTTRGIEQFLTASADRAGKAFVAAGARANEAFNLTGARREVEKFVASSTALLSQRSAAATDPLGIRSALAGLSSSPLQRVINEQASAEQSLAAQRARARDEYLAGIQRQADAAIAGIRAETAARTAAFQQAANEGNALASLQRQQVDQAAGYLSRQTGPTVTLDPVGARAAAAAARAQATELEAVARAAEHSRDTAERATAADLNLATASRTAADAAKQHATRLAEVAVAEQRTQEVLKATTGAIERQGAATSKLSTLRKQTLVYTASDIVASLGSGIDPFRILLQQGPQVAQVFALEQAGLRGVLGLLTPTTIAVGALTGATIAGAAAYLTYANALDRFTALAQGSGRVLGVTGAQLEANAVAAARAGNITVAAARDIEAAYVQTGQIGADVLTGLTALTSDFAAATGQSAQDAQKQLAAAFVDPAKGADDLAAKYGTVSQAAADYIQTLVQQGDVTSAQLVLLQQLQPAFDGAAEHANVFAQGLHNIELAASKAYDFVGRLLDRMATGGSLQDQIKTLEAKRDAGPSVGQLITGNDPRPALQAQIDGLRYQLRQEAARSTLAQTNRAQANGQAVTDQYTGANVLAGYQASAGKLRASLKTSLPPEDRRAQTEALAAYTHAIDTFIPRQDKANQLAALDVKIAAAKSPAEKSRLASQRALLNSAGQVITAADAQAQATSRGETASIRATGATNAHAAALRRHAEAFAQDQAAASDKVQRIAERFDKAPTLVDQSKAAVRDLDELIAKYGKLNDATSQAIAAKARLARATVDAAPQSAIEQATAELTDQLVITDLISQGRETEADALQDKLALLKRIGVELGKGTPAQEAAIGDYDTARAKRDRAGFDSRFTGDERLAAGEAAALRAEIEGRSDIAELIREQVRYEAEGTKLNAVQLEQLRQRLATEYQLTRQAEQHARLIDIQVGAARDLQAALTEALTDPFKKGSLGNLDKAITSIRKTRIAQELSVKLFGDMGDNVERALTRGSAPLHTAADDLRASAKELSAAARAQLEAGAAAARGPLAVDAPSFAQLATTPSAFGITSRSGLQAGPDEILVGGRPIADNPFAGTPSPFAETTLKPDLSELSKQLRLSVKANTGDKIASTLDRFQVPLTYLAGAVGGKAGGVFSALANVPEYEKIGETIGRSLGNSQAGAAIGQGVGAGQASDQLLKALGVKSSKLGASIGGAIGNAILPGIGGFIGGAIGGAVGGLFKKSKYASSDLNITNGVASAGAASGRGGKELTTANALGGSLATSLNSIAQSLGVQLGSAAVSIGYRPGHSAPAYRVDPTGKGAVKNGSVQAFETEEEAVAYAIRDAINDGVLNGVRASTRRLITAGADLQAQLNKALAFEGVFTELKTYTDPVGAAIDALDKQFAGLRSIFAEAGASTEEYSQLEQLYALKRADAVKAAAKDVTSTLQGLLDDLRYKGDTGLSLRTRNAAALAAFNPLADTVRGGGVVDQNDFSDKARALLDIQRQHYGSTSTYFDQLADITNLTAKAITNAGGTVTAITSQVQAAAQQAALAPANDNAAAYRAANSSPIASAIQASQLTPSQSGAAAQAPFNTADMVAAIGRQTDALGKRIEAQTATTASGFELLIGTTSRLGGSSTPSSITGLARALRNA
ncbi:phage tail length tape measure family protein [Sphingomonas sp. Tas61C01]|uniref:phage tail length tape measure family protein n=1 Tax=Sphingomonas sp. Tas61C01 TaxID=3458297 RepID=UPI00403E4BA8